MLRWLQVQRPRVWRAGDTPIWGQTSARVFPSWSAGAPARKTQSRCLTGADHLHVSLFPSCCFLLWFSILSKRGFPADYCFHQPSLWSAPLKTTILSWAPAKHEAALTWPVSQRGKGTFLWVGPFMVPHNRSRLNPLLFRLLATCSPRHQFLTSQYLFTDSWDP